MVLPEGTPAPEPRRSSAPRLAAVGLAVGALFAGILALGQATSPPPEPPLEQTVSTITIPELLLSPSTTLDAESFTIAQIASGERFFWIRTTPSGRLWPIDLVSHGGQVYLFGSEHMAMSGTGLVGMRAWVSADGVRWQPLGQLVDEAHEVNRIVSTGPGLVALGSRVADGAPVIWTSASGMSWTETSLTSETPEPGTRYRLADATVFKGRLRVVGVQVPEPTIDVLRALPASLMGPDPRSVRLGFEVRGDIDDAIVHVYGPLGLHAFSIEIGELGLDPSLETILIGPDPPARQYLWSFSQSDGWTSSELPFSMVEELWVNPAGVLLAYGSGNLGSSISTSDDGTNWVINDRSAQAWTPEIRTQTAWRSSLVGSGPGEDLFFSSDGVAWESLGTGDVLPDELGWALGPVGAGPAGLATVALLTEATGPHRLEPVSVDIGDVTLSLDLPAGRLRVVKPGYQPLEMVLGATEAGNSHTIDFTQSTVTFIDPRSGDELVTVGFPALEEAMARSLTGEAVTERGLLFSPDGESWGVQDMSDLVPAASEIDDIAVLHDRVLVLTRERVVEGSVPPRVTIFIGQIDP